ncbi:MAG: diacylglycerol kinase family protein [Cytophagales bacterium]|nr:diacylglycerol kinase family protein [Cytophagales bacterium]
MDVRKMVRSFTYAGKGLKELIKSENNFQFHLLAAVLVILFGFLFKVSAIEWVLLFLQIGLVFMAEAFNTSIEKLADHLHPERHNAIGKVKDVAAAGVLLTALLAVVVACIIFIPKFIVVFL